MAISNHPKNKKIYIFVSGSATYRQAAVIGQYFHFILEKSNKTLSVEYSKSCEQPEQVR